MGRRIYIVPKGTELTQKVIKEAIANKCPEIVDGIPPVLAGKMKQTKVPIVSTDTALKNACRIDLNLAVTEDMLPCVYEEL